MANLRIFISTGEVSGDLQGSLLIAALHRQAQRLGHTVEIVALGGDRMAAAGAKLLGQTSGLGAVGLLEALPYILPTIALQRQVQLHLTQHPPDLIVLIDYFGANIRIGRELRRRFPQVPIVYYIAPQEWVWSLSSRNTQRIVSLCDRLIAIFPEEARYYRSHGASVAWVGHPLLDRLNDLPTRSHARDHLGIAEDQTAIALLPASRWQELKYLLPVMFEAAQRIHVQLPQATFWIPLSLPQFRPALEAAIQRYNLPAHLVTDQTQTILAAADLALAKSGTVNLELALLNVPQVVMYRVHPLTAWIAQHLLHFTIPFMSPPNLVLMEPVVPEFLQDAATSEVLAQAGLDFLRTPDRQRQILSDYARMRQALGEPGVCDRAAEEMFSLWSEAREAALNG